MTQTFRIARLAGVDFRLHWSVPLLVVYLWMNNPALPLRFQIGFAAGLLLSILLHELGHAAAAALLGLGVDRVALWMLGGWMMPKRPPTRPRDEVLFAAAGPAVNLALAALLWGIVRTWLNGAALRDPLRLGVFVMMLVNVALALFNLLPIYPLDGGRILRALLGAWLRPAWANGLMLAFGGMGALGLLAWSWRARDGLTVIVSVMLLLFALSFNARAKAIMLMIYGRLLDRGHWHLQRGEFKQAIAIYDRSIAGRPRLAGLYLNRGVAYHGLGEYDRALSDFNRGLALAPGRFTAMLQRERGVIYTLLGEYERALVDFEQAALALPNEPRRLTWQLNANVMLGNLSAAERDADRLIFLEPSTQHIFMLRTWLMVMRGDYVAALPMIERASAMNPQGIEQLGVQSLIYYALGRPDEAQAVAVRLLQANPIWLLIDTEVPNYVADRIQCEWAQRCCEWAEELGCDQLLVAYKRGNVHRMLGDSAAASAAFRAALALPARTAYQWLAHGHAQLQLGNPVDARIDLERALQLGLDTTFRIIALGGLRAVAAQLGADFHPNG